MPFGLMLSILVAAIGARMFDKRIEQGQNPRVFTILAIVFVCTLVGRELDAGFWRALGLW